MAAPDWSIVFYTTPAGDSPVEAFLAGLDAKTQIRFAWSIEQLRLRNTQACPPLVRHLEGKLWEPREESATNIDRLLDACLPGRRIVFLHGFRKKTPKAPRREPAVAAARLADLLRRGGIAQP